MCTDGSLMPSWHTPRICIYYSSKKKKRNIEEYPYQKLNITTGMTVPNRSHSNGGSISFLPVILMLFTIIMGNMLHSESVLKHDD